MAMVPAGHGSRRAGRWLRHAAAAAAVAVCWTAATSAFAPAARGAPGGRARSCVQRHVIVPQGKIPSAQKIMDMLPNEPGRSSDDDGFDQLCTRWNREEAEAVDKGKRTLQSPNTTKEAKMKAIDELEYWAIRRGGYDAEIVLIGTLRGAEKDLAGAAHVALKKTWASHFNAWVNTEIATGKSMQKQGNFEGAMKVFDKVIFNNPLWGEGYHLRAQLRNQQKDVDGTIEDLRKALEFCPNNYVIMVELALILMEKRQGVGEKAFDETAALLQNADDLCPFLPIDAFMSVLYAKAPTLKEKMEALKREEENNPETPPYRLLPEHWVSRPEAVQRPNQAFLRIGAELEQWFSDLRDKELSASQVRKLWSRLIISWDPDKHPRELNSFTTQVHGALKNRREREMAKATSDDQAGGTFQHQQLRDEDGDDAAAFLRHVRRQRRQQNA